MLALVFGKGVDRVFEVKCAIPPPMLTKGATTAFGKNFSFTEEMLRDKSLFQMLNVLQLLLGHRNYIGMFSHTCMALEEIFGADAFWNKPVIEKTESGQQEQKAVIN